jgi:DNA end-binding protein Ku
MVSIPVSLHPVVQDRDLSFNQIHRQCGSRIKYQKWCPVDECVVPPEEIARGYEISKGRFVYVEEEDLESLPVASKHTITVDAFVDASAIDPIYFEKPYYIEPEEVGKKPYALLLKALEEKGMAALGKVAIRSKESLTLLRATGGRIMLETMHFPDEIREMPHTGGKVNVDDRELKMALSLVDLLTEEFNPEKYKDEYRDALLERIQAKAQGEEIREAPEAPQTEVLDLMEALRRSIEAAKGGTVSEEEAQTQRAG